MYSFYANGHLFDKIARAVRFSLHCPPFSVSLAETKKPVMRHAQRAFKSIFLFLISLVEQEPEQALLLQVLVLLFLALACCRSEMEQVFCPVVPGS
jgi:hypothetical protein